MRKQAQGAQNPDYHNEPSQRIDGQGQWAEWLTAQHTLPMDAHISAKHKAKFC